MKDYMFLNEIKNIENINFIWFICMFFSYLSGSIPFGLLISKIFFKCDIRDSGSGNIGATNVTRILGKKIGIIAFILDFSKCAIPLYLISKYIDITLAKVCMHFFIFGHMFSIFLLFKGGKGVSTLIAGISVIYPTIAVFILLSWYFIFKITKYSSLASIISVIFFVFCTFISSNIPDMEKFLTFMTASCILLKHTNNIKNLLKTKELSFRK